jgi:hypothetical protein
MTRNTNSNAAILSFLKTVDLGASVIQIAEATKLSLSRTRELLAAEMKAGTVDRAPVEPGSRQFVYSLTVKDEPKAEVEAKPAKAKKAKVDKVIAPNQAKGHPSAKKIVNPQPTLEVKKLVIRRAGGKMIWADRLWHISANGKDHAMASRELAAMTVGEVCKAFHLPFPTDVYAAQVAKAAKKAK